MILACETSGTVGSVALVARGATLRERHFDTRQEACRLLPAVVSELLEGRAPATWDLAGLAVSRGPGSFNGLRVGLAFAKAVAHALDLRVVGVSTPEAWAAESLTRLPEATVAVLQPARRGHAYLTGFAPGPEPRPLGPTVLVSEAQALEQLRHWTRHGPVVLTGDWSGLADLGAGLPGAPEDAQRGPSPRAGTVGRLAEPRLALTPPESHFTLRPEYVSVSQAERTWGVDLGL